MITRLFLVVYATWIGLRVALRRPFKGPARPGWNFQFETAVAITRSLIQRRRGWLQDPTPGVPLMPADLAMPLRASPKVAFERGEWAGRPAEIHTAAGWQPSHPTILYLHGGGYVSCSPATHRELLRRVAVAAGARCIAPDYRKAPEHRFPAAVEDAYAAYQALLQAGVDPRSIVVGGDSAGGGLALALLLRLRDDEQPMPCAAVLLSPWVDLECNGDTLHSHARFDYLSHEFALAAARMYAGQVSLRDPLVSPLYANLERLPPMLVQTGGVEVFVAENLAFVEKARAAGVDVTHEISEHMVHVFQAFTLVVGEGRKAIRSIGTFVRARAGGASAAQNPSVAVQR
jgi:epsilon-lactone hydrolase